MEEIFTPFPLNVTKDDGLIPIHSILPRVVPYTGPDLNSLRTLNSELRGQHTGIWDSPQDKGLHRAS